MIKAACHCGAVRFEIAKAPVWVLDCNCTLCRRYGGLWSYYVGANQALLLRVPDADATQTYLGQGSTRSPATKASATEAR